MRQGLKIQPQMNLRELADRMGDATIDEAYEMMKLLVSDYHGHDTNEVPDEQWLMYLDEACEAVRKLSSKG